MKNKPNNLFQTILNAVNELAGKVFRVLHLNLFDFKLTANLYQRQMSVSRAKFFSTTFNLCEVFFYTTDELFMLHLYQSLTLESDCYFQSAGKVLVILRCWYITYRLAHTDSLRVILSHRRRSAVVSNSSDANKYTQLGCLHWQCLHSRGNDNKRIHLVF